MRCRYRSLSKDTEVNVMLKLATRGALIATLLGLSGCLLTSPHHGTVLSSRTAAVPFQAWTTKTDDTLRVECMPTNRFGTDISSYGSWSQFGTLGVSDEASRDSYGARMYSASASLSLPESCWYLNRSNGWYYTSVRVLQSDYAGFPDFVSTPDYAFVNLVKSGTRDDPACVGEEVGRSGSWSSWYSTSCFHRYTSGDPVRWLVLRAEG